MNISKSISMILLGGSLLAASGCQYEEVFDPNNPSLASVRTDASKAELQVLVSGLEARHRGYYGNATQMFGSFGREVWAYFGSDPRFTTHWLGVGVSDTYVDFFGSAGTYVTPYVAIRHANVLIEAANASTALSDEERSGLLGFAKTIKAYQYLWPLLQQWDNGIRIDVADPLKPGPFVGKDAAFDAIRALLEEANNDLAKAGGEFSFSLSAGFTNYSNPTAFAKVNRAIAARVALYDGAYADALTALDDSFMDMAGDFMAGPAHVYGQSPDVNNPLYYPRDASTSTILIAHPSLIEDAEAGDTRLNKFFERVNNPVTNSGIANSSGDQIPGVYQDNRYATNVDAIAFIRNEELILIHAEASLVEGSPGDAIDDINLIRNTHGLADYSGATTADALLDEILNQRRYSLWAEGGHRWIDLRRTGKLDETHIDLREGGTIFNAVPRRSSETNWDESQN